MVVESVRRLAADILHVGTNKIRIKPEEIKKAEEALTRADVKGLIKDGIVFALEKQGRRKKEKRRKRGHGNIKGRSIDQKERWMVQVRSQRKYLKGLLASGALTKKNKKVVYGRIKSGLFKNKKTMLAYLKENNMINEAKLNPSGGKGSS